MPITDLDIVPLVSISQAKQQLLSYFLLTISNSQHQERNKLIRQIEKRKEVEKIIRKLTSDEPLKVDEKITMEEVFPAVNKEFWRKPLTNVKLNYYSLLNDSNNKVITELNNQHDDLIFHKHPIFIALMLIYENNPPTIQNLLDGLIGLIETCDNIPLDKTFLLEANERYEQNFQHLTNLSDIQKYIARLNRFIAQLRLSAVQLASVITDANDYEDLQEKIYRRKKYCTIDLYYMPWNKSASMIDITQAKDRKEYIILFWKNVRDNYLKKSFVHTHGEITINKIGRAPNPLTIFNKQEVHRIFIYNGRLWEISGKNLQPRLFDTKVMFTPRDGTAWGNPTTQVEINKCLFIISNKGDIFAGSYTNISTTYLPTLFKEFASGINELLGEAGIDLAKVNIDSPTDVNALMTEIIRTKGVPTKIHHYSM